MTKRRLDQILVERGLVASRSQAASYIRLGKVSTNGQVISKPGQLVSDSEASDIRLNVSEIYVSRAALKLASVASDLRLSFKNKTVLDVGSSTGGFSDYALKHGAAKVIAVDSGSNQLHPTLAVNPRLKLYEKTDIRDFKPEAQVDLVLIDVSFISLRQILPGLAPQISSQAQVLAMVKPQFEAGLSEFKHKGVIKNKAMRRQILKDFEAWVVKYFVIKDKADSLVAGAKGNAERFYLLNKA